MSNMEALLKSFMSEYAEVVKGLSSWEVDDYMFSSKAYFEHPNFDWGFASIVEQHLRNEAAGIVKVHMDELKGILISVDDDEIKDVDEFYERTLIGLREGTFDWNYKSEIHYNGDGKFYIEADYE